MKIAFAALAASTLALSATAQLGPIDEHDFACGAEVDFFCDGVKDVQACLQEHRSDLGHTCIFSLLEHEALHCGIEVEVLCGADRHDREKFHECVKEHYDDLKKICPEETRFDRFDEIENIKCGFELAECCSKVDCKNSQSARAKCITSLEDSTEECAIAVHEEKDFLCGIQTEHACGKFYNEPLEFIECIEREKPCADLE